MEKKGNKSNWANFAAISCTHCPYQSEKAIKQLLVELKSRKNLTHFIHLGDVVDAEAASVHPSDPTEHTLLEEFTIAADMLKRIRAALPNDCKLILLDGNHDDNLKRPDPRRTQYDIRELLDPRKMDGIKDEYNKWKHIPYRHGVEGCYQLGPIIFSHGYAAGANSDELEAIQLAMSCGGYRHRLIVRGHTHRPVPPTQCRRTARVKLPWWYSNVGYMAFEERPAYTHRFSVDNWGRAMMVGECQMGRLGRMGVDSWKAHLIMLN